MARDRRVGDRTIGQGLGDHPSGGSGITLRNARMDTQTSTSMLDVR